MKLKKRLFERVNYQELYHYALNWSSVHYNQAMDRLFNREYMTEKIRNGQQQHRIKYFEDSLTWSHRSKTRGACLKSLEFVIKF